MYYRQFGRTGLQVSALCLGSMLFGGKTPEAEAHMMIDYALDAGINVIDTANIYERGQSEAVIGTALKRNGKRSKIVLNTKVWGRMEDDDPNAAGLHRRHIREQCEASLRRLQTDYIDVVICQSICPRWRHISCPAVGSTSQLITAPESCTVQLLTHIRDCGAIFDRDRVHWSIGVEMSLSARLCMDLEDTNWFKLDRIW